MDAVEVPDARDPVASRVIASLIEVHRTLGPGLLESAYEACVCRELSLRGIPFERQRRIPIAYKGLQLRSGFRVDLIVDETLIVEIKAVERMLPIHVAQALTYLKLTGLDAAILVNFNVRALKDGLRRLEWRPRSPSCALP